MTHPHLASTLRQLEAYGYDNFLRIYNSYAVNADYVTSRRGKVTDGNRLFRIAVRFIKGSKWDKYLKALDWKEFARHYNGPSYAENQYDKKLAKAYEKYK